MSGPKHVTIVVPVYGDWPSLGDCIESLKEHVAPKHTIMLVNDCGPDVELMEKNIQAAVKGYKNCIYYRNNENLGFIGTCNRAVLELDKTDNDILLLNSDTEVTAGFLEELLEVLYAQPNIGAVSPRSNNARIATVPLSAVITDPTQGVAPQKSWRAFEKLKKRMPRYTITPVAIGFCMLIKRSVIATYGLFDPIFGKGYGEEVDFCLRIKKHGYLSALSNRSFVYHHEARSFTRATKEKLLEINNKIIDERYPGHRANTIRAYIRQALINEEGIYPPVKDQDPQNDWKEPLKKILRRNNTIYRLARKTYQLGSRSTRNKS